MDNGLKYIDDGHSKETTDLKWLKRFTDARIALGKTGCSLFTNDYLSFNMAHAKAKDSVYTHFDREYIMLKLKELGLESLCLESAAQDRMTYLSRPDLGKYLSEGSKEKLKQLDFPGADILIVIGDGLSSKAVHKQSVPLIKELMPYLQNLKMTIGPIALAQQCRVALGDDIAKRTHCKLVVMMIGERPGLSSPDSLGVYITYKPNKFTLDSDRNCVSNIRPEGLSYEQAAFKIAWLIDSAFYQNRTGVLLKDLSDDPIQHYRIKPIRS